MKTIQSAGNFARRALVEAALKTDAVLAPFLRIMSPRHLLFCSALFGIAPVWAAENPSLASLAAQGLKSAPKDEVETNVETKVRPISQREFADAATTQIEFLKELRAWRNTLRGQGAKREWNFSPLGREALALSLGNVAPTSFGGGAGIAAKWKGLEIGSTSQPEALDETLARFDSLLAGEKVKAKNPTDLHWMRAQILASPRAQLEVLAARASRDGASRDSVSSRKWRGADFQSAKARFQLPANWQLNGDFGRADVDRESDGAGENEAASAWGIAASGPLSHPFGVASARANWRETERGYVAPTAENGALGVRNGDLALDQNLQIGPLSGRLNFGAATQRREGDEPARAGEELFRNRAQSAAQMRLALTPNLSLTGQGEWNSSAATRAFLDQKPAPQTAADILLPSQERELSRQLMGDVGVQWNFSRALSVAVSLGTSSQTSHLELGETAILGPQNEEMRRGLEVRRKSGQNDFRVRFSQRARRNRASTANLSQNASSNEPVSQWRVEAARPLIAGMRFKTILDWASDAARGESARRIEAQLQLARAARIDARYREGDLAPGLLSDEWSSAFGAPSGAPKQWSARFGAGSAASGAGLGLSMEIVRNQGEAPDSYRVGLQFK